MIINLPTGLCTYNIIPYSTCNVIQQFNTMLMRNANGSSLENGRKLHTRHFDKEFINKIIDGTFGTFSAFFSFFFLSDWFSRLVSILSITLWNEMPWRKKSTLWIPYLASAMKALFYPLYSFNNNGY